MKTTPFRLLFGLALVLGLALPAIAEEPKADAPKPVPVLDTDEDAAEALKTFKTDFKAKGLRGEEKIAQKVFAMKSLAQTQHRSIVDQLAKLSKASGPKNIDVRTAAVGYLGMQRALPGAAGVKVVEAIKRHKSDMAIVIAGLEAIQELGFQAAPDLLRDLMKHKEYSVQKAAMQTIKELGDVRLLDELFALLKEIKKAKGESWDGVSVTYDTGTPGTHDQEMAEAIGRAEMAKKKKGKGRGGARAQRDMGPVVEEVLKALTGEEFESEKEARDWLKENEKPLAEATEKLEATGKAQIAESKKRK